MYLGVVHATRDLGKHLNVCNFIYFNSRGTSDMLSQVCELTVTIVIANRICVQASTLSAEYA